MEDGVGKYQSLPDTEFDGTRGAEFPRSLQKQKVVWREKKRVKGVRVENGLNPDALFEATPVQEDLLFYEAAQPSQPPMLPPNVFYTGAPVPYPTNQAFHAQTAPYPCYYSPSFMPYAYPFQAGAPAAIAQPMYTMAVPQNDPSIQERTGAVLQRTIAPPSLSLEEAEAADETVGQEEEEQVKETPDATETQAAPVTVPKTLQRQTPSLSQEQAQLFEAVELLYIGNELTNGEKNLIQTAIYEEYPLVKRAIETYEYGDTSLLLALLCAKESGKPSHTEEESFSPVARFVTGGENFDEEFSNPREPIIHIQSFQTLTINQRLPILFRHKGFLMGVVFRRTPSLKIFKKWNRFFFALYNTEFLLFRSYIEWYNHQKAVAIYSYNTHQFVSPIRKKGYSEGDFFTVSLLEDDSKSNTDGDKVKEIAKFGMLSINLASVFRDELFNKIDHWASNCDYERQ